MTGIHFPIQYAIMTEHSAGYYTLSILFNHTLFISDYSIQKYIIKLVNQRISLNEYDSLSAPNAS